MAHTNPQFETLFELSHSIHTLSSIERLLFWDQETMMPKEGIGIKTQQKKELAAIIHNKKTSKEYEKALQEASRVAHKLTDDQKRSVELMEEDFKKAQKLPTSFVTQLAEVSSQATHAWEEAKRDNNFNALAPHLEKIIELMRKKADLLGYEDHPYNPLVDEYEPHMTTKVLDQLFEPLGKELVELTKQLKEKRADDDFLYGSFNVDEQFGLSKQILDEMGLKSEGSRIDPSAHPFCMPVHMRDLRLTTRAEPSSFFQCLSASMHEGGHGLYEQGLNPDFFGLPLGEAASIGIHESQSKFWETFIGLSRHFWKGFYPEVQKRFPSQLQSIPLDSFFAAINKVEPSMIRIHADEVTYGLHVILRYEAEKAFMEGKLNVRELPEYWNSKMNSYLGITPPSDSEGCMQDIHWSSALFGYFPTYALGNLYAAQLFNAMKGDHPDYALRVENRDYQFLTDWLRSHVHEHGRRYEPQELIKRATGKPLAIDDFVTYLKEKYT